MWYDDGEDDDFDYDDSDLKDADRYFYQTYVGANSPEWQWIKTRYKSKHPDLCAVCGASERLDMHHITYERVGHEWDADLILLCHDCHGGVHALRGPSNNWLSIRSATEKWIEAHGGWDAVENRRREWARQQPGYVGSSDWWKDGRPKVGAGSDSTAPTGGLWAVSKRATKRIVGLFKVH